MKSLVAVLPFLGMCLPAMASPTSESVVLLEHNIGPLDKMGRTIALHDAKCRYVGQLAKEPIKGISFLGTGVQTVTIDRWYIDISRRKCGQQTEAVKMRVNLPKPPFEAGRVGNPPGLPSGYRQGTKFTLLPSN